jgi:hypothetical protein
MAKILNFCASCETDFASVGAFDRHRIGVHAYTFQEGQRLDPPREDGRRCMSASEMQAAGMEVDPRGRWRIALSTADQNRLRSLKGSAQSDSEPESDRMAA